MEFWLGWFNEQNRGSEVKAMAQFATAWIH